MSTKQVIKAFVEAYKPQRKINFVYVVAKVIIWLFSKIMLRMDIQRHSRLPKGPKIFAINHPSITDPFLIHLASRLNVMITRDAFTFKYFAWILNKIGEIPVFPGGDSLQQAITYLQQGKSIAIFPEGVISPAEGGLARFRSGAARLALSTGACVIPVGIHLDKKKLSQVVFDIEGVQTPTAVYLRGAYNITLGEPLYFEGDVNDWNRVTQVTTSIQQHVKVLVHESEYRMQHRVRTIDLITETIRRMSMLHNVRVD